MSKDKMAAERAAFEALATKPEFAALTHWGIFQCGAEYARRAALEATKAAPADPVTDGEQRAAFDAAFRAYEAERKYYDEGKGHWTRLAAAKERVWQSIAAAPAAPAPDPEGTKCLTHEAIAAALTEGRPLNHMQRACLLGLVDADKRKQTCYDAAIQDAERYRWLRDQWDRADALEQVMLSNSADGKTWVGGGVLDQRIDAAIAASKEKA